MIYFLSIFFTLELYCYFIFRQVDAALGAEEMVEQLGEKKMALEDEVIIIK